VRVLTRKYRNGTIVESGAVRSGDGVTGHLDATIADDERLDDP
jgi:hypothetical protein